jgi:uncharacterized membrane protein
MKNSSKISRTIYLAFSLIGLATAIYLTIQKLTESRTMCLKGIGDCWTVNTSPYSEILGIPIAVLGAGAYLSLLVLYWLDQRSSFWTDNALFIMFGITLAGVIYSGYLTYVELAIIKALCPFCVVSAVSMVVLFIVTTTRLVKTQA